MSAIKQKRSGSKAGRPVLRAAHAQSWLSKQHLFPKMVSFTEVLPGVPRVLFVEFLDATGQQLPVSNGFVVLAPRTFIRVTFSAPVSQAFFFLTACWVKFFQPSQLIGFEVVDPPQRTIRFVWDVPPGIRNSLFIFGCSESICGRPEIFLVMSRS
ncbi:MAG: hypothetical protein DDT21_01575 [Syntrophomonadaceae bacterium]|nr:hypothetical protein [Bacillota bacterium]